MSKGNHLLQLNHEDKLRTYHDCLLKWQKTINIVSPTTIKDAWNRHFLDSAQIVPFIGDNVQTICDIGSGGGFPGLIIAIERPDIHVHLVESDARKCAFLRTVSRETSLDNVSIHNARIEDVIGDIPNIDCITSRALASLRQLMTYTQPVWEANTVCQMLLLKGENYQFEIDDAYTSYDFDVVMDESCTNKKARILTVNNITTKAV